VLTFPSGERREQRVFLCDFPKSANVADVFSAYIGAFFRWRPTLERRMRELPDERLTPQIIMAGPTRLRTAMSKLR
jgi:hypothetical protein